LDNSYTKPIVRITRKIIKVQKASNDPSYRETAKGKRKITSKSKTMNKIATKKNWTENLSLAVPSGTNPHEYGVC
jgi:hypothetical protein